ncbi:hypothetical protein [Pseudoxanthomonas sp. UTMC 1351]|uniref:hypothetical protein n=1 Tax=Pseudoxanthomonas sp. UTMC 1351 TaxID=2695853 RepID=UPI0034CDC227
MNSLNAITARASEWVDLELDPLPASIVTPFGQRIELSERSGKIPRSIVFEIVGIRSVQAPWRRAFHSNPYVDWIVRSYLLDDLQSRVSPTQLPSMRRWLGRLKCRDRDPEKVARSIFKWAKEFKPAEPATDQYCAFLVCRRIYDWGLSEGLPGFDEHYADVLSDLTPLAASSDHLVSMRDVIDGPFTRAELHLIELGLRRHPDATKRQIGAFLLARDWGLRPVQMSLMTVDDIDKDELGPFVRVCSVKGQKRSKLRRWHANKVKRYIADDTYAALVELALEAELAVSKVRENVRELAGSVADELKTPLFPVRSRSAISLRRMTSQGSLLPYAMHAFSQSVGSEIRALTHLLKIDNPRASLLGDPDRTLRINCQRLRRTKGTSMVLSGSSIEDVAEALDHENTASVKHYFRYNRDLHALINQTCTKSPEIAAAVRMWEGRIEHRATSDTRSFVASLGGCTLEGVCPHHPTVSCYACHAFRPWRDGNHEESLRSIDSLAGKISQGSSGPLVLQLEAAAYGARSLILALTEDCSK